MGLRQVLGGVPIGEREERGERKCKTRVKIEFSNDETDRTVGFVS